MNRLTIVGTTPNGAGVILSDDKGAKFVVANDPRLAAVSEFDLSRQLEIALETFSPREIQSRVRAGASAEVVAAETGWPLDKVLRYAEPLLAERAYIAEQAQAVEVRRSGGGVTLLATSALALEMEPESASISWDAWRREDGKWVVTATFTADDGPRTAQWTYDHAGRNIHPLDDQARWLMGVGTASGGSDGADAITDALELIADRPAEPVDEPAGARPRLVAVPDAPEKASPGAETVAIPHPSTADTPPAETPAAADAAPAAAEPTAPAKKPPARKPRPKRGRASVPSWDEILFGATRSDD